MIKSGVSIGVGSVIGAGAVVVKDVEPYSVVGGVPAKFIKYRFDKNIREMLLESKWWEIDSKIIASLSSYIDNPVKFINKLKKSI